MLTMTGICTCKIVNRDGKWWCSEVINGSNLGYGTYVFKVASSVYGLDPNVVSGYLPGMTRRMSTAHREIDIEFSTWNIPGNENSQYVVQPFTVPGNIYRFNTVYTGNTTQGFVWQPADIFFQSLEGDSVFPGDTGIINSWTYSGGHNPPPGR